MRYVSIIWAFLCLLAFQAVSFAELPALIPREVLFGNPTKDFPEISPDGKKLAYLAPSHSGVLNVWIQTIGNGQGVQLTDDRKNGIYGYDWAGDSEHIFFLQDNEGDENDHLKLIDLPSHTVRDVTPYAGMKAQNLLTDPDYPGEVLIGLNKRDPKVFDMYRVNVKTGELTLETENPGDVLSWAVDANFQIRAATAFRESDLSTVVRVRDSKEKPWRDLIVMPFEKSPFLGQYNGGSIISGFSKDGKSLYVASCMKSDTTRLVQVDVKTGQEIRTIAQDPQSDLWNPVKEDKYEVVIDHRTHQVQAAGFNFSKPLYQVVDPNVKKDFEFLAMNHSGIFELINRDANDDRWIIQYIQADAPDAYYLYERPLRKLRFLFSNFSSVSQYKLVPVEPITFEARDGMKLNGYLTRPVGIKQSNLPLILHPHGGPWFRDDWLYNPFVQFLANRGYAVLQLNFRGSIGFGMRYLNAGTGQWGVGSMQNDLTDAVRWAIQQGIADPKRIAIVGGSYGGYATLSGITFTPELYACAVDIVGPSDVGYLMHSFPAYWGPVKKRWIRRIGFDAEHNQIENERISPIYHVDQIRVPLLIGHGKNDPRVKQEASDRIVAEMRKKKLDITYVVYPDEGHGFLRPENNIDFYGRMEEFLAKCIGGRAQAWKLVPGSSAQVH